MLALAAQVSLGSIDSMQEIQEMASLCHKLLRSVVKESLLNDTVKALANAICCAPIQPPTPDDTIECLCTNN